MNDISTISNIYFVGTGGIGTAALAQYFLAKGENMAACDLTFTTLTDERQPE